MPVEALGEIFEETELEQGAVEELEWEWISVEVLGLDWGTVEETESE